MRGLPKTLFPFALCLYAQGEPTAPPSDQEERKSAWIDLTSESGKRFSFAKVMKETSGTRVIPLDSTLPAHQLLSKIITAKAAQVGETLSRKGSPAHEKRRINEVSALFENALRTEIDMHPDFSCQIPKTRTGKSQRSGYPDLRIKHLPSGTIAYLDPKLFEETSRQSSLRTFYYEAATDTTKVTEDALHLLLGFPHDGQNGQWKFSKPILVDLSKITLRLKVEFSASNKDLYPDKSE